MADHWTSATLSCLISFFLNLASYIPWLASSCNDQISNRTTASASHRCASTTRCPVVDDSISIVVDVSLPTDDGSIRTSNAHGTRSTTTAGTSQTRTFDSSRSGPVHLILKLFQRQELGKEVLGFAVPMTTGLLFNQYQGLTHLQVSVVILALSIRFTTTWNGMLLREMCPCVASALECFRVASVLVTFFGLVSSVGMLAVLWLVVLALSLVPCSSRRRLTKRAARNGCMKVLFSMNRHAVFNSSRGYMEQALGPPCIASAYKSVWFK